MGHEDRERKFEQALTRALRGDGAGARNEADARAAAPDETAAAVECPDAATLAAFHESMLSNEEMSAATEHIAACSRCQQILLLLEATDEVPLQEAENDLKIREPVLSADTPHTAPQTASLTMAGRTKPAMKTPTDISRGRGFKTLRWAAPAGAIAAGLLIWFAVRDYKVQTLSQVDNVQVAQEQPRDERLAAPRAAPPSPAPGPVAKTKQLNELRKDNGRIQQPAEESGARRVRENAATDSISSRLEHGARAETSTTNAPAESRESGDYASRAARDEPQTTSSQADVSVMATAPAMTPAPNHNSLAQSTAPAAEAAKTTAKQSANTTQTVVVDHSDGNGGVPVIPTEHVAVNDKLEFSPSLKKVGAENAKIISAPKGRVQWRLLPAGRIERSSDGGITWLVQNSGVDVELIAGSAPSNLVCWIIGRGGTILKTTDGGAHWTKVAWPNPGEIVGIQGLDAMHGIVDQGTAGIPARFATNDGGDTWFRTNK
jgi:hypothetical protein